MIFHQAAAVYYTGLIVVAVYFFVMATANILEMKKRSLSPKLKGGPFVSVLIPARNEEDHIERCVNSLRVQDYGDYEILVIDDNSSDSTYDRAREIARKDSRVAVYQGRPLPPDWNGKAFALHQLAAYARGDILLFTDADTVHAPTSVSWAATNLQESGADFISGYVGQVLKTFGERITVPVMFFLTGFVIPMFLNKVIKFGYFSAAVGQYIAVRREVFQKTGGFEAVKNKTSEDIYMARHIKEQGYRTEFLDMADQVRCRMYNGFRAGVQGIGKNIYDFTGKNPWALVFIALLILFFFCLPFPLLVYSLLVRGPLPPQLLTACGLSTLTWLVLFISRKMSWYNAFVWPVMYLSLLCMVFWSFYRTVSGRGFVWKGRVVN
ncbi:MAG: glycosyltransferase [Treponema sp.]|jgi:chlorobactene glucosyltransferase|nr:glycosyltransferase [Treponema sp.]